jgi:hypothetical protein
MDISRIIDGKKFMWDGAERTDRSEAEATRDAYSADGFETRLIIDGDKFYLFTRRVSAGTKAEGVPPA